MVERTDLELLRAWRGGDRSAGSELFRRHVKPVYRFFRNKIDGDVEDLVQRTFVACVEGRDRFREESSIRTYLFGIAHNLLRDRFRRGRREPVDLEQASIVDLGASPSSLMGAREEENLLVQALRRIPIESQVILEMIFWEELTGPQLAEFLGVPVDTARSRLRRAKQQLEAAIGQLRASPELVLSTISDLETWAKRLRGLLDEGRGTPRGR